MKFIRRNGFFIHSLVLLQLVSLGFSSRFSHASDSDIEKGTVRFEFPDEESARFGWREIYRQSPDLLVVNLEFAQWGDDLSSIFSAPQGVRRRRQANTLEVFLREHPNGRILFVGRAPRNIQLTVFNEVTRMIRTGQFVTTKGEALSTQRLSFLIELEHDLAVRGNVTIGELLRNSLDRFHRDNYTQVTISKGDLRQIMANSCVDALKGI